LLSTRRKRALPVETVQGKPSGQPHIHKRRGGLNVRLAYTWNDPATGQRLTEWADESLRLLCPGAEERIYANSQTYEARNGAAAVYGVNLARLAGIKYKFDRENFFRRNSNIPPAGNARAGSHALAVTMQSELPLTLILSPL